MPMTAGEKANLVMKGMSGALVRRIDGLGWTSADTMYLMTAGITPAQIQSLLLVGAGYSDIELEADKLKTKAREQKIDKVINIIFGSPQPLLSNLPGLTEDAKNYIKACEMATWLLFFACAKTAGFAIKRACR